VNYVVNSDTPPDTLSRAFTRRFRITENIATRFDGQLPTRDPGGNGVGDTGGTSAGTPSVDVRGVLPLADPGAQLLGLFAVDAGRVPLRRAGAGGWSDGFAIDLIGDQVAIRPTSGGALRPDRRGRLRLPGVPVGVDRCAVFALADGSLRLVFGSPDSCDGR
jgi:hypothetical protein